MPPSNGNLTSEIYLMCDDIKEMPEPKIVCSAIENQRWALLVYLTLQGGGKIGVYEAKHTRP